MRFLLVLLLVSFVPSHYFGNISNVSKVANSVFKALWGLVNWALFDQALDCWIFILILIDECVIDMRSDLCYTHNSSMCVCFIYTYEHCGSWGFCVEISTLIFEKVIFFTFTHGEVVRFACRMNVSDCDVNWDVRKIVSILLFF